MQENSHSRGVFIVVSDNYLSQVRRCAMGSKGESSDFFGSIGKNIVLQ